MGMRHGLIDSPAQCDCWTPGSGTRSWAGRTSPGIQPRAPENETINTFQVLWIRTGFNVDPVHHFRSMPMRIRIQGFDDQKLNFSNSIFLSLDFMKIVQVTATACSPQKRTSSTSNMKFLHSFYFCGSFLPSLIQCGYGSIPATLKITWMTSRSGFFMYMSY
jgi:hypothetical protein